MTLVPLPPQYDSTRQALHRVAAHILGRRRHSVTGKFGLRASPGGFATPAFGAEHEVVRVSGRHLVRERTGTSAKTVTLDLATASLADAARLVDVDLGQPFSVGHETPELGDADAPLAVDGEAALAVAAWFAFGWRVIDEVSTADGSDEPTVLQLWPEHFDAGLGMPAASDSHVNLGVSPGDWFHRAPYIYVGPWDDTRPGDPSYWNAPFGAALVHEDLLTVPDPVGAAVDFVRRGLRLVGARQSDRRLRVPVRLRSHCPRRPQRQRRVALRPTARLPERFRCDPRS